MHFFFQVLVAEACMLRLTAVLFTLLLSGCAAVQDFGTSLRHNIQGEYYLQEKDYARGLQTFGEVVKVDPYNAEANYYYGRFLLAEEKAAEALPYLEKAAGINPKKDDYHFWLGVAYGEKGQEGFERKSYKQALQIDPSNTKALTYLGNNLLRAKQYTKALGYYEQAIERNHNNPQALYNRSVILKKLARTPEEKLALHQYLDAYPSGSFARRAADRLNALGDHSYRNYKLGARTITLAEISFVPFKAELARQSLPSLDVLGATVSNMPKGKLNVITYQLNNRDLAKRRAFSIRNYLNKKFPQLKKTNRIQLSWFDVPERRKILTKQMHLDESVVFFLTEI